MDQQRQSNEPFGFYKLHSAADKLFIEPINSNGDSQSDHHLEIDRVTEDVQLTSNSSEPIPPQLEVRFIRGIIGVIRLVAGPYLIVITRAESVGSINNRKIWKIVETDTIPYQRRTLHMAEKQIWHNRNFLEMIQLVLSLESFYYATSFDITQSLQRLDNATPEFRLMPLHERADERFFWNKHLLSEFTAQSEHLGPYTVPIMLGFVVVEEVTLSNGASFHLSLISRRSCRRAGTRFWMRGADDAGHAANFVETEQVVEWIPQGSKQARYLVAFVQARGSIPLKWTQHPNLRWQPTPQLTPGQAGADEQTAIFGRHITEQRLIYGGPLVIVNLVNQKGRELAVGKLLEATAKTAPADHVKYIPFDFHRECSALDWSRLSKLTDQLKPEMEQMSFFCSPVNNDVNIDSEYSDKLQYGVIRTNCMDSLDRTNVVQSMIALESLTAQLQYLGILRQNESLNAYPDVLRTFKHLWADNGDQCSRQYAGTGAMKADFTRYGKRTASGYLQDGYNAVTRYFRNNFGDGYKQDSVDLFLGKYRVDAQRLPDVFETSILRLDWWHSAFILVFIVSLAMTLLCLLVSDSALTYGFFWAMVSALLFVVIFSYGEEFVNQPKLKTD